MSEQTTLPGEKKLNSQYDPLDDQMLGYETSATQTLDSRYPELTPEPVNYRPLIFGVIVAVSILIFSIVAAIWLYFHPATAEVIRDIVLIFLGISTFFILVFMVILIFMLSYVVLKTNDLIQLLNREVRPLLQNLQETTGTVRGTTTFISDYAAKPVISVVSSISAVKAAARSLFQR